MKGSRATRDRSRRSARFLALGLLIPIAGLGFAGSSAPSAAVQSAEVVSDNCANVRIWFSDARAAFPAAVSDRLKANALLDLNPNDPPPDRKLARFMAEQQAKAIFMGYMEQVAANAWPTTRDTTLRGILKAISDGRRVVQSTIALGRYCQAGRFVGL